MGKVFGERWEMIRSIGEGGQAHVYLAKDLRGEHCGELVLKVLKNVKRRDRFINEARAGLRLKHDAIIRVLDHSSLDDDFDKKEKPFLVMPYATGRSLDRRVGLYKGSLDSTLIIAERLAGALEHAHDSGVIHRDVKPENILFDGADHDCLLSDFGICLLQDDSRWTETGEVVGPREFIAPELQGGGQLDVTPAADLYSLGKLIYFMYSGGVVVPRERQREGQYSAIWEQAGIRSESLGFLLDSLICSVERRIQTASEVRTELRRIRDLDQRPGVSPVSPKVANLVAGLAAKQHEARSNEEHNLAVVKAQEERFSRYCMSVWSWLGSELATYVKDISVPGAVEVSMDPSLDADALAAGFANLRQRFGVHRAARVRVKLLGPGFNRNHSLFFFIGTGPHALMRGWSGAARVSDTDIRVSFLPYYAMDDGGRTHGFLSRESRPRNLAAIHQTFHEGAALRRDTTVERWPTDRHEYKGIVDEAFVVFFGFMKEAETGRYGFGT